MLLQSEFVMVGTLTYWQFCGSELLPGCKKQYYVEQEICKWLSTIKLQVSNQNIVILVLLVNRSVNNQAFYTEMYILVWFVSTEHIKSDILNVATLQYLKQRCLPDSSCPQPLVKHLSSVEFRLR